MQETKTFSTNKIIVLVVFICAAIITSLFVYQMNHKPKMFATASNDGIIFPVPRDINLPVDLYTSDKEKLPQQIFLHHWTLLYFGFTHCNNGCPSTLDKLNRTYKELVNTTPNLQILFISLDPERDTPDLLNTYVQAFNSAFIGATGKPQDLRKLQSQLGVFSERESTNQQDYQIQHTSSIFLIDPYGRWAGMFNGQLSPNNLVLLFNHHVKLLSKQYSYA